MASNRHLGRIIALQTLYECEFRQEVGDDDVDQSAVVARNLEKYQSSVDDVDFVKRLVSGVLAHVAEIDAALRPLAPEWPLEQIARIDRSVLRLGLYELVFAEEKVPPKVVINEAVELAKAFGSDNSGKFVNGVLGTAYRTLVEDADNEDRQL
ncbi:MAG: transcription antitermination factor NusB [Candidatus Saccharibacteria bacterium]|nr:transcription antitermination factor NusB [Candidatus Saccharibacteria bacterium]